MTPQPALPKFPYTFKRSLKPTPTPFRAKFYSLNPTPHPTPLKSTKAGPKPLNNGAVSVLGPRNLHYHTLYQDPTPGTAGFR